jgi:phosphatidate cytidylyltransferase
MSDESWRSRRDDDFSEFGSLFDDAEPTQNLPPVASESEPEADEPDAISFGDSDTGSLPHWTEPPTGEIPRFDTPAASDHDDDELDVWSSFSSESPVWKDDEPDVSDTGVIDEQLPTAQHRRVTGEHGVVSGQHRRVTGEAATVHDEPSRITIGTDPSGMPRRQPPAGRRRGGGAPPPVSPPPPKG